MYHFDNLIDGVWQQGEAGEFSTYDPSDTSRQIATYSKCSESQLNTACQAAVKAQKTWWRMTHTERLSVLKQYLTRLEENRENLTKAASLEQGKIHPESNGELTKALNEARAMLRESYQVQTQPMSAQKPSTINTIMRRPRGVIAAITPWNFPILTPMRKIIPALVFGNAMILKPAEVTPAVACLLVDAGVGIFPDGLLQLVNGEGRGIGEALITHKAVTGVTFTGSVDVGKRIMQLASQNLTEVSLELGGKNAVIINDTDNLDDCLNQVVGAAYACSGQRCTAISRILVAPSLYSPVIEGLKVRLNKVVIGNGFVPETTMGPLSTVNQRHKVLSMVEEAKKQGARVVAQGPALTPAQQEQGYFVSPVVLEVDETMDIAGSEVFGPVITLQKYDDFEHALTILNNVSYGLTSALFSNDNRLVQRFIMESESGMLHINHGTVPDDHMPFGGIKDSGVGAYSVGASAANFYTTEHAVYNKFQ
ncbi:aldehyde dehydrogenase family protein [Grimontia marina]|uniref:Aldehyde dehydrogenase, thermostable n=1 Tax=Grimontia marina TaxID=646534 RepID=A0A128F850_9GAMM|nr:aldehyde dehydrogenase family protein [Grimontia marina]CZF82993.1 Aldehyde dehydrogenase, thermostable [Grimontia marina]